MGFTPFGVRAIVCRIRSERPVRGGEDGRKANQHEHVGRNIGDTVVRGPCGRVRPPPGSAYAFDALVNFPRWAATTIKAIRIFYEEVTLLGDAKRCRLRFRTRGKETYLA